MKRLLWLVMFVATIPAFGAEDGTLSLSPAVVMLRGSAGQSATQTLTLMNGTSRPFSFDLVANDVVAREGKRVLMEAGQVAGGIAATAVFSKPHVDVPPGGSVSVDVTFTVPQGTAQRAVIALFRGTNRVMSGNTPMTASLGALMTFTLSDTVAADAAPLTVRPQSASENLGVSDVLTNRGTEPLLARGMLAILDAKGALAGKVAINPHRLLPGETAELHAEYAGELAPGHYRLVVSYDYEGQALTRSAEVDVR